MDIGEVDEIIRGGADPPPFETVQCSTWDELVGNLERLERGWLFRGQRVSGWPLKTSLERYLPGGGPYPSAEAETIFAFRQRAHLHLSAHHMPSDELEWRAVLQHWGGPTRFLDVTRSPYVAAYFAVEDAADDGGSCAVWAIHQLTCLERAGEVLLGKFPDLTRRGQIQA